MAATVSPLTELRTEANLQDPYWTIPLLLAWAPLFFWGMSAVELSDTDEARSGVLVRDMIEGGRWMFPRTPDGYLAEKPPIYYGLAAAAAWLFGLSEWTLRGVSALFALGTLALLHRLARGWGSPPAAALAAVSLASNALFAGWSRQAMVDMTFTFFVTAGLAAWIAAADGELGPWRAALLAGGAFGLATLTKGPLGLALPLAFAGGDLLLSTRGRFWRARVSCGPVAAATATALAVALAWYLPATILGGAEFIETSLVNENLRMPLGRAEGIGVSHRKSIPYYVGLQFACLIPLLPLAPLIARGLARSGADPLTRRLLAFLAGGFLLFLLAANKRSFYLLPLQPIVALLVARAAVTALDEPAGRRDALAARITSGILVLVAIVALSLAFRPSLAGSRLTPIASAAHVTLFVVALGSAALARAFYASPERPPGHPLGPSLLLGTLVLIALGPARAHVEGSLDHTRPFVADALRRLPPDTRPVVLPPIRGYALDYYWPGGLKRDEAAALTAPFVLVRRTAADRVPGELIGAWRFQDEDRDVLLIRRR